jgi:hypothetical protein
MAKKMMYDLYYRDLSEDALISTYETMADAAKGLFTAS